jgi:hypothetical protein
MASTYSTNLKIELMATGENSGTWGNVTNTNMGTALEQAIIGLGNPDFIADANLTITISNTNSSQAARCLVLNVTSVFGSLSATRELIVPTSQKQYIVQNNTTGGQSITVKTSAGTGITVPNGRKAHLYVDGVNVIQMFDFVDINGGTIDGATVGAASASTGAFTSLTASGATTLNGAVALGDAAADLVTVPGTVNSNLLFTDNSFDIGASGATRPRNLFLAGAATIGGNLSVGGTLTLTGGVNLNGNVTVGDSSADTLTINATITSNLLFTDNTYDIGASGATRPRNLFLAGNITAGGAQTLVGALTVDSTTDSSSTTTGSIQTDGGVGIAKALFVGTTANIAGAVTLGAGTANGVAYLNGSKVLTTGSALTFDGTTVGIGPQGSGGQLVVADAITTVVAVNQDRRYRAASKVGSLFYGGEIFGGLNSVGSAYFGVAVYDATSTSTVSTAFQSDNTQFYISGSEAARLTSSGLEIKQSQLIGYSSYAGIGTNGLAVAGNVGIGTASPGAKLEVNGTIRSGSGSGETLSVGSVDVGKDIGLADGQGIVTGAARVMTFKTSGNVGIGTASPAYKLDVNGSVKADNFVGLNNETYFLNAAGNNGIIIRGNTGSPTNQVELWTGGGAKVFLNSAGNLGLGVTPSAWGSTWKAIQVGMGGSIFARTADQNRIGISANAFFDTEFKYIGTGQATFYDQDDGSHFWYTAPSGTAGNAISFTQAMTLDASGRLAIGTTSIDEMVRINGSSNATSRIRIQNQTTDIAFLGSALGISGSGNANDLMLSSASTNNLVFGTNTAERARIDSSGNLLVGTTNDYGVGAEKNVFVKNGYVFASDNTGSADNRNWIAGVNGYQNGSWQLTSSGANNTWPNEAYRFAVTRDGSCYNTTGTYGTLSDARFKDNVATARPYLEDLIKLRVVKYSLKSEQSNVATKLGLIAQEVEEVFPNMVDVGITVQGEEFKSVKMSVLVPMLLSAIQEQQTLITALTARITALESSTLQ